MASDKQISANQTNAKSSTGPQTAQGKLRSSQNSIKHGLLSQEVVLPGEQRSEFESLYEQNLSHLDPHGPLELHFAERIVIGMWRLRRLQKAETALYSYHDDFFSFGLGSDLSRFGNLFKIAHDDIGLVLRYETTIDRGIFRALHELHRLQAMRRGEQVTTPAMLDVDIAMNTTMSGQE